MSRFTAQNPKYEIAYGQDEFCGYFIQVFLSARRDEEDEGLLVNLDQTFDGLTPEKMASVAEEYGFHIELPEGVIE